MSTCVCVCVCVFLPPPTVGVWQREMHVLETYPSVCQSDSHVTGELDVPSLSPQGLWEGEFEH